MEAEDKCHFCRVKFTQTTGKCPVPATHFWKVLLCRSVQDCYIPSATNCQVNQPKLNFSLNTGKSPENSSNFTENSQVCRNCCEELEKLSNLHSELESVKSKINSQVKKLGLILGKSKPGENADPSWSGIPSENVSLTGTISGKENILEALKFLTFLCSGIAAQTPEPTSGFVNCSSGPIKPDQVDQLAPVDTTEDNGFSMDEEGPFLVKQEVFGVDEPPDQLLIEFESAASLEPSVASNQQVTPVNSGQPETRIAAPATEPEPVPKLNAFLVPNNPVRVEHPQLTVPLTSKLCRRKCPECGLLVGQSSFMNHVKSHQTTTHKCQHCHKQFASKKNLTEHLKTHTSVQNFTCAECGANFEKYRAFSLHRKTHENTALPIICEVCRKGLRDEEERKRHEKNCKRRNQRKF